MKTNTVAIESGLFPGIVLQRNSRNVSEASISGVCAQGGPARVRVTRAGRAVAGCAVSPERAGKGRFHLRLIGIPCGGPYRIDLCVGEAVCRVDDVRVGDVWLLGGQSNMEGIGLMRDAAKPHAMVRAFNNDDVWRMARDPLHMLSIAVDPVHGGIPGSKPPPNVVRGVGPGLSFGLDMWKRTGVPQGLIASAHGGTSMEAWNPARRDEGGRSLYGAMVRRLRKNGGRVAGMLWYQGESDANADAGPLYRDRMIGLIRSVRRDAGDARLPVVIVQLSRVVGNDPGGDRWWNHIQDEQRLLPGLLKNVQTVPAVDLTLDDGIHISGRCNKRLGRRLAEAMDVVRRGRKAGLPPIALHRVSVGPRHETGQVVMALDFKNVRGRLCSSGRPTGFEVFNADGRNILFDAQLHGSRVELMIDAPAKEYSDLLVHYGRGSNPACNVTDEGDRSLPVLGPLPLRGLMRTTPFRRAWTVSACTAEVQDMKARPTGPFLWQRQMTFTDSTAYGFANCNEILSAMPRGCLIYETAFNCPEAMKVKVLAGYDGPVRIWVDGALVFTDLKGANPAITDGWRSRALPMRAGRHEIAVALGSNGGKAWGIFLRLEWVGPGKTRLPVLPQWISLEPAGQ